VAARAAKFDSVDGRRLAGEAWMVIPPGLLLDGQAFSHGRLSERKLRRALAARPKWAPDPNRVIGLIGGMSRVVPSGRERPGGVEDRRPGGGTTR
jgi:hypothetical protein